jgi:hypothetical protein
MRKEEQTPGTEGMRSRYVDLLGDAMKEFYTGGNLIDLAFLADVMYLHVCSREGELLSDTILRHLGFEKEGGELIVPKSNPPEASDNTVGHQLGSREERLRDSEMGTYEFAENLETAQILWRRYPDLVESEEFP